MKHRTADLEGALLDAAVAIADGARSDGIAFVWPQGTALMRHAWQPSTNWAQGGPIIEREQMNVGPDVRTVNGAAASVWFAQQYNGEGEQVGPTLLIAAMRAYVASKFGEWVDLP